MEFILGSCLRIRLDHGTAMAQSGHEAHKHRYRKTFGKTETIFGHIICFLLVGGFKRRHKREISVETRVLFILRRVHRRVIGSYHEQTAVGSSHGRVYISVSRHIHTYMFHRNDGTLAAIRHTESLFDCRLLIAAPMRVNSALARHFIPLHKLENLCRRSAGIRISPRKSGVDGS